MRKIIFVLAFMLIGVSSFANNNETSSKEFNAKITITEVCPNNKTTDLALTFRSLNDFKNFNVNQITDLYNDVECTVSISLTVSVGYGRTYAEVTLKASGIPCDKVGQKIKQLKSAAEAALS